MSTPTAAVALGSGGARGYAHIGVLQVLDERGYDIVAVSGSSMGALVAGLYAAGTLDEYVDWVTGLSQLDVMRLLDVSLTAPGVIHADKILDKVREILGDVAIEDLAIPFTAVATDLTSGRPQWFQRGPVDVAIRASIAIPGVITPHVMNGRVLVDGGILDPLPIAPLAAAPADVVIGVDLGSEGVGLDESRLESGAPSDADAEETVQRSGETGPGLPLDAMSRLRRIGSHALDNDFVKSIVDRVAGDGLADSDEVIEAIAHEQRSGSGAGDAARKLSRFAVMNRSLDIMQEALARHQLAALPPDVLIQVPRAAIRSLDFHRATEAIELGRALTERALDSHASPMVTAFERPRAVGRSSS
ncbi:patatin-like phospholipase family protein [Williamsia deligens]|uniref:Patatin-like phospholipase family protein n=1 Tax=Williamsia deligens TaxID=321325 RepID=A0ABW3G9I1_9NOCA|nr:patatin-like phospholipase family protein [Williamsia deligens]MCP2192503.1 NTE family protein [Williamsia deligens]